MLQKEEILLILYSIIVIAVLVGFVVLFFISFTKRKNKLLKAQFEAEKRFAKELEETRIEIQEQTLKNVAWELHDNIGQLLSVVNMQLNLIIAKASDALVDPLKETSASIKDIVGEVRLLSKTLNNDVISKNGLLQSIQNDLERFKRLKFLDTSYTVTGDPVEIIPEHEIILFRIFQEFTTNVLKHARAKNFDVILAFESNTLIFTATDDGVGFDTGKESFNSGMETMRSRAALVGATYTITSKPDKGTTLYIKYPILNAKLPL